jgi:hypothetical protein
VAHDLGTTLMSPVSWDHLGLHAESRIQICKLLAWKFLQFLAHSLPAASNTVTFQQHKKVLLFWKTSNQSLILNVLQIWNSLYSILINLCASLAIFGYWIIMAHRESDTYQIFPDYVCWTEPSNWSHGERYSLVGASPLFS